MRGWKPLIIHNMSPPGAVAAVVKMQRDVTQENFIKVNVVVKEVFFMCGVATCNDVFPKMNFQGLMLLFFPLE